MPLVIIASGASLTRADADFAQEMRQAGKCKIMAINTSYQITDPDYIYAADRQWWAVYHDKVPRTAECWTQCKGTARAANIHHIRCNSAGIGLSTNPEFINGGKNSGHQAINLAYHFGYRKLILLGYDYHKKLGKNHWHGDHPANMANAENCESWIHYHDKLSTDLSTAGVGVINATIGSALYQYPIMPIAEAIKALNTPIS